MATKGLDGSEVGNISHLPSRRAYSENNEKCLRCEKTVNNSFEKKSVDAGPKHFWSAFFLGLALLGILTACGDPTDRHKHQYIVMIPFELALATATMLLAWSVTMLLALFFHWDSNVPDVHGDNGGGAARIARLTPLLGGLLGIAAFAPHVAEHFVHESQKLDPEMEKALQAFIDEQQALADALRRITMSSGTPTAAPVNLRWSDSMAPKEATKKAEDQQLQELNVTLAAIQRDGLKVTINGAESDRQILCGISLLLRSALWQKADQPLINFDGCPSTINSQPSLPELEYHINSRGEMDAKNYPSQRFRAYAASSINEPALDRCLARAIPAAPSVVLDDGELNVMEILDKCRDIAQKPAEEAAAKTAEKNQSK